MQSRGNTKKQQSSNGTSLAPPTTTKKQKQQASAQTQTWSGGEAVSSWLRGRKNFDARPQSIAIDVDAVIIHKLHENKLHKTPLNIVTRSVTAAVENKHALTQAGTRGT